MASHLTKPRVQRSRTHLSEVRADILADLKNQGEITETQQAWAERLTVAYRTLKITLQQLRSEGKIKAVVGLGRSAKSSYKLSKEYLSSISY